MIPPNSTAPLLGHLEKLHYFRCVGSSGSFQAAARKLRISQPALSKAVRVIEDVIGEPLFVRSRRGVALTRVGEGLFHLANEICGMVEVYARNLVVESQQRPFMVRFGTHEIVVQMFWCSFVRSLKNRFPNVQLELRTTPSASELVRGLAEHQLDCCLIAEPPAHVAIEREITWTDSYGFFAHRQFVKTTLGTKTSIPKRLLETLPLIYAPQVLAGPSLLLKEALTQAGISQPSLYDVKSLESVETMVEGRLGIGILPVLTSRRLSFFKNWQQIVVTGMSTKQLGAHSVYFCMRKSSDNDRCLDTAESILKALAKTQML